LTPIYLGKNNDKTLRQIVGTLPNKGNNNAIQKGKSTKSPLLTEELLEKLKLSKTKHKNLWKFYRNPFSIGRVMDNETVPLPNGILFLFSHFYSSC
jgi:hypothetical protein